MFWLMNTKPFPLDASYLVGVDGSIWSTKIGNKRKIRKLNPGNRKDGYRSLMTRGKKSFLVHRMVLLTHVGPPMPGQEACHLNGNRSDNRLSNLIWASHVSNEVAKLKHGIARERKLTPDDARRIKYSETGTYEQIADRYGINFRTVDDIRQGRTWAWV